MLHVSIIFELLRSQPRMVFWLMTLTQAALWWLLPSVLYSAPPGDLPMLLAVGHEFQVGTFLGPPLASWLAEIAFSFAGMPAVYLLSQICVIATYWAVFTLGRAHVPPAILPFPTSQHGPQPLLDLHPAPQHLLRAGDAPHRPAVFARFHGERQAG